MDKSKFVTKKLHGSWEKEFYFCYWINAAIYRKSGGVIRHSQPAFTCSKLTIETLEQGVKYVQS